MPIHRSHGGPFSAEERPSERVPEAFQPVDCQQTFASADFWGFWGSPLGGFHIFLGLSTPGNVKFYESPAELEGLP
jgi:hypothetical protein